MPTDAHGGETMPNGVLSADVFYGCEMCRNNDGTPYHRCKIDKFFTVLLILANYRSCRYTTLDL